jgi:hypothetical protein
MPSQYLQKVSLVDQGGNTVKQPSSCRELFADMAAGYKLPPPSSVAESLGYSEPGALLLPVSVRAPHTIYQTVGLIAYSEQLVVTTYSKVHSRVEEAAATASSSIAISSPSSSYSSDSEDIDPNAQLILQHTCTSQIGIPNTLLALPHLQRGICILSGHAGTLGAATTPPPHILNAALIASAGHENALVAFSSRGSMYTEEHVKPTPFRLGTYIIDYSHPAARSAAKSSAWAEQEAHQLWLDSVVNLAFDAFAVLIFNSLSFSHQKGFSIGFFCPWRCLNEKVSNLLTTDAIARHTRAMLWRTVAISHFTASQRHTQDVLTSVLFVLCRRNLYLECKC